MHDLLTAGVTVPGAPKQPGRRSRQLGRARPAHHHPGHQTNRVTLKANDQVPEWTVSALKWSAEDRRPPQPPGGLRRHRWGWRADRRRPVGRPGPSSARVSRLLPVEATAGMIRGGGLMTPLAHTLLLRHPDADDADHRVRDGPVQVRPEPGCRGGRRGLHVDERTTNGGRSRCGSSAAGCPLMSSTGLRRTRPVGGLAG